MPIHVLLFFIDSHLWPLLERRPCWDTVPTRVAHLITTMLCWKGATGRQQVPICTRYKVLRSSNVPWHVTMPRSTFLHNSFIRIMAKKINNNTNMHVLQCPRNLEGHLGICMCTGILFNDDLIRNLAELPAGPLWHRYTALHDFPVTFSTYS